MAPQLLTLGLSLTPVASTNSVAQTQVPPATGAETPRFAPLAGTTAM